MRIVLASNNRHKYQEFQGILSPRGIDVAAPSDLGLSLEVEETGKTFAENARLKAEALSAVTSLPAVADDSGLVVDALAGRPGIYSARYGGAAASDRERYERLLGELQDVPEGRRTARFVAAVALARPGRETLIFEGEVEGLILPAPRGTHGFGYDPIFYYPPLGKGFGELTEAEKAAVSHRGRALARLVHYLQTAGHRDAPVY